MNVGAQADVIREIPADVVRIIVDHDVVAIPVPVVAVSGVEGSHAEEVAAEPEPAGASTNQPPAVVRAESTFEVTVLPGVLEVKACVFASPIMADPLAIAMDVRCLRVVVPVAIRWVVVVVVMRFAMVGLRSMVRDVSAAVIMMAVVAVIVVLGPERNG